MKTCSLCKQNFDLSNFYKRVASKDGLMTKCIPCSKLYKLNNPEKSKSYVTKYHSQNRDKILAQKREFQDQNRDRINAERREYYQLNKEKQLAVRAAYQKANPDKCNAVQAKRRSNKINATPSWSDPKAILAIYTDCKNLTKSTGIPHHVDHIVPLISDRVCGLHVHYNLQVLTAVANLSKSNSYWPDM